MVHQSRLLLSTLLGAIRVAYFFYDGDLGYGRGGSRAWGDLEFRRIFAS